MEFLKDDPIEEAGSPKETSKAIRNAEGEKPEDELETSEAWPHGEFERQKKTSGKWLNLLKVIGKQEEWCTIDISEVNSVSISEKKVLPWAVLLVGILYSAVAVYFYFE